MLNSGYQLKSGSQKVKKGSDKLTMKHEYLHARCIRHSERARRS